MYRTPFLCRDHTDLYCGNTQGALIAAQQALKLAPDNLDAQCNLGCILMARQDQDHARNVSMQALPTHLTQCRPTPKSWGFQRLMWMPF